MIIVTGIDQSHFWFWDVVVGWMIMDVMMNESSPDSFHFVTSLGFF